MTRFHNPGGIGLPPKLLNENVIVSREDISLRNNVHVDVAAKVILLSKGRILTFKIFAVAFDILDHQVLLAQLISVGVVIQNLVV